MKILFVHLLRMGDTLMYYPVMNSVAKNYPNAHIELLTFNNSESLKNILPAVHKMHFIQRDQISKTLLDPKESIFKAYDLLETQLKEVLNKDYDLVINLSHTKESTFLTTILRGKQKLGAHYNQQGKVEVGSPWIRYMNEIAACNKGGDFHFQNLAHSALQVASAERSELSETSAGRMEVAKYTAATDTWKIAIQCTTSDSKKSYPLAQWRKSVELIQQVSQAAGKKVEFLILASPVDKDVLENFWKSDIHTSIRVVTCSMEGALSLLKNVNLLITLDTSLKHLAQLVGTPTLEIVLGSSHWHQTGVTQKNSYTIHASSTCYPCKHSAACNQIQHLCSQSIDPDFIAMTAWNMLAQTEWNLVALAEEFENQYLTRSYIQKDGTILPIPYNVKQGVDCLFQAINQMSWRHTLQTEDKALSEYYYELLQYLKVWPKHVRAGLQEKLSWMEAQVVALDRHCADMIYDLKKHVTTQAAYPFLATQAFYDQAEEQDAFEFLQHQIQAGLGSFFQVRQIQTHIQDLQKRNYVKRKLLGLYTNEVGSHETNI